MIPKRSDVKSSIATAETADLLHEAQKELVVFVVLGLCGLGVLAGLGTVFPGPFDGTAAGLLLFGLASAVWLLSRHHRELSAWILVLGCSAVLLMLMAWGGFALAAYLLMIPAGLAALTLGAPAGIATAAGYSLLLFLCPTEFLPLSMAERAVAALATWASAGMIALALRPFFVVVPQAWLGYEQSRTVVEQTRDVQLQLKQALEDLTAANLQLTRLNQLANGLRQAAEEARQSKEQFVANVSHELRTPLNIILAFSQMIVEKPKAYGQRLPPALLADLAAILRNSQHLSSLIDDVLDLSQIESSHMALTRERAALGEIIEAAVTAVQPLYESKGLYVRWDIPADLPPIYCDRTRIREVILNLLSNAVRFTQAGGVEIRARRGDGKIVVSVTDTGPGIAPEDLEKLFRPFQQLDGSIRRRNGGSGLGLAISKNFVEMHGGRMWVESTQSIGTTFFFSLPVELPVHAEVRATRWLNADWPYLERTERSTVPAPSPRPRLVILEAEDSLQRLLSRYLENAEIVVTDSWDEAKRAVAAVPTQALLINDVAATGLPDRTHMTEGLSQGTPIIICTVPGLPDAANRLGATDYLVKPVKPDRLLAALDRLHLPGKTVLVVDDEPDALRLFWRVLAAAERGYRVLTATDARHALQIMREQHPDAVLLDLIMPDMDGFQLLAIKNRDPDLSTIPVVVVSAQDPVGQPIVSNTMTVARAGGLSLPQLLATIQTVSRILSPLRQPAVEPAAPPGPESPETAPG